MTFTDAATTDGRAALRVAFDQRGPDARQSLFFDKTTTLPKK